ncbi:hypothetical protein L9F63_020698, partial [Diploptera punctata]
MSSEIARSVIIDGTIIEQTRGLHILGSVGNSEEERRKREVNGVCNIHSWIQPYPADEIDSLGPRQDPQHHSLLGLQYNLPAMTQDDKKHIRELGLRRILKARQIDARRKTKSVTTRSNRTSTAVERCVKLVTEASGKSKSKSTMRVVTVITHHAIGLTIFFPDIKKNAKKLDTGIGIIAMHIDLYPVSHIPPQINIEKKQVFSVLLNVANASLVSRALTDLEHIKSFLTSCDVTMNTVEISKLFLNLSSMLTTVSKIT